MKVPQWQESSLGEIAEYINGRAFKPTEWEMEGVPIIRIQNLNNPAAAYNYYSKILEEKYSVKHGDLLYAWSASLDSYIWRGGDACLNQHIFNVKPFAGISKNFIFYLLKYVSADILSQTHGSGMVHITKGKFEKIKIFLPALAEQHYLADKLDSLLARIQTLSDQLAAVPALLKQFRQSVLADAVSGRLLNRGKNSNGWEEAKFGDVITSSGNGISKRKSDTGMDTTVLRLADFKDAERITGNERQIQLSQKEIEQYVLKENDLLVIRVNGSAELAGKFILYKDMGLPEAYCDHFIRFRIDKNKLLPRYFLYVANSGEGRAYLRSSLSTSAGQNTINQTSIKNLIFKLPPLAEQAEIVRRVEALFALADDIEQQSRAAAERVVLLTQSVLAKAFRGELSEQWRREHPDLISGDNSAAALLARIQAERAATGKKSRRA